MSILSQDPSIGHLTMEILKPTREERIKYLTKDDFEIQSLDLGEAGHDTKVWSLESDH